MKKYSATQKKYVKDKNNKIVWEFSKILLKSFRLKYSSYPLYDSYYFNFLFDKLVNLSNFSILEKDIIQKIRSKSIITIFNNSLNTNK